MHPLDLGRAITRSRLRVRFCETDLMGIVHHSNYLAYFGGRGAGRMAPPARGVLYADWAARGIHLPVVEASVRYRAAGPLRLTSSRSKRGSSSSVLRRSGSNTGWSG